MHLFTLFHSFSLYPELGWMDYLVILDLPFSFSELVCSEAQGPKDRVPARSESEILPFGRQRIAVLLAFPGV